MNRTELSSRPISSQDQAPKFCQICGKRIATDTHHLIFGYGLRALCDEDNIVLELCRDCHGLIHKDATAGYMSKMLGEAIWEERAIARDKISVDEARQRFLDRYGRAWL